MQGLHRVVERPARDIETVGDARHRILGFPVQPIGLHDIGLVRGHPCLPFRGDRSASHYSAARSQRPAFGGGTPLPAPIRDRRSVAQCGPTDALPCAGSRVVCCSPAAIRPRQWRTKRRGTTSRKRGLHHVRASLPVVFRRHVDRGRGLTIGACTRESALDTRSPAPPARGGARGARLAGRAGHGAHGRDRPRTLRRARLRAGPG